MAKPAKPKITRFATRSGSIYEIDHEARTWARLINSAESNRVRTPDGTFLSISPIRVGSSVTLTCPPIVEGTDVRWIQTTPVVRILPAGSYDA